ncbi:MAG TPA: type IV pilus twitching motility protein PilT [Pyrinomonadaceae bacterium]|jgi:twitching motility protein PilT
MEKLNDYLQTLLSTCSYELHLEPNRNPYLVSATGENDVNSAPLLGTQISMMVFPLIPNDVKMQLPSQSEVEFVHPHNLGKFSFLVKKSPAGFKVTIRPLPSEKPPTERQIVENLIQSPPVIGTHAPVNPAPPPVKPPEPPVLEVASYTFESSAMSAEKSAEIPLNNYAAPEIEFDEPYAYEVQEVDYAHSGIEIVSVNDPEFQTTFSDESTYEPPAKRQEFETGEYASPSSGCAPPPEYSFAPPQVVSETYPQTQNYQNAVPIVEQSTIQATQTAGFVPAQVNNQAKKRMDALFYQMSEFGASDLHMSVSMPPMVRKDGKMQALPCNETTLTPESIKELLTSIMPAKNQEEFTRRNDSDFAYEIPMLARFRANIFADRKGMGGVFRIIPTKILTAQQLGLSQAIMNLCELSKGLVVVTGPTGSGKSTTLCAMIDHINKTRDDHIITIEDPIEFTHENQKCLVNQREVHNHTDSFKDALRAALREDPDILLVGEMRDLETISIAIETAETGHLVFGTLHTTTAASTVDRIIDQFPADRQQQIRVMLSESLKGVIAQTLLPKKGGGRVAALEILIVTPAISNLIREGKTFQINSSMQTGKQHGMVMLNDALFDLVQKGIVEPRDAYIKAVDKTGFESMLTRGGFKI